MLVFFTFMPLGAAIGGLGGALLFGVIAIRDAEIAIEREPAPPARPLTDGTALHLCNAKMRIAFRSNPLVEASNIVCSIQARRRQ